jgi:AcrR family transcriptional regulator
MMIPVAAAAVPDARTRILDAAERIVQARGVPALTLEAAARDAGVSKGGLLYHFASKEALLKALLQRLADFIAAEMQAGIDRQPEGPHRVARACVAWALEESAECMAEEHYDRAAAVFLAAHHHDPALLEPVRAVIQDHKRRMLADGTPPGVAVTVLAASDGLFMAHLFGTWSVTEDERHAMRATLDALIAAAPVQEPVP